MVGAALEVLQKEVAEGHSKAVPKAATELRNSLKEHARYIEPELDAKVHAALAQAGELEGWQRWRADQLREKGKPDAAWNLVMPALRANPANTRHRSSLSLSAAHSRNLAQDASA